MEEEEVVEVGKEGESKRLGVGVVEMMRGVILQALVWQEHQAVVEGVEEEEDGKEEGGLIVGRAVVEEGEDIRQEEEEGEGRGRPSEEVRVEEVTVEAVEGEEEGVTVEVVVEGVAGAEGEVDRVEAEATVRVAGLTMAHSERGDLHHYTLC